MKIYIIAGEASGDLHGSNLIKAIKAQRPDAECRVWGGDLMEAAGGVLVKHYRDLAFMGFVEVLANLRTILRNLRFCKQDILEFQPDVVVFIDYPGFNLRIAQWLREQVNQGVLRSKSIYYIAPQIWAWHTSRVHAIKRDMDKVLVILPFEQAFYEQYGVNAVFTGHPLLDVIHAEASTEKPITKTIALLPGSRKQEVKKILPVMLSVVDKFPDYQFVIAASTALPESFYREVAGPDSTVKIVSGQTYEVLQHADAALVKSGTSTLETALLGTPEVVCYASSRISMAIAKMVVKIKYISLVNLIADAPVVKELIQEDLNTQNLEQELRRLLEPETAQAMRQQFREIRSVLGERGAAEKAAAQVVHGY
jgi:lipid-A-disaccharide synthase